MRSGLRHGQATTGCQSRYRRCGETRARRAARLRTRSSRITPATPRIFVGPARATTCSAPPSPSPKRTSPPPGDGSSPVRGAPGTAFGSRAGGDLRVASGKARASAPRMRPPSQEVCSDYMASSRWTVRVGGGPRRRWRTSISREGSRSSPVQDCRSGNRRRRAPPRILLGGGARAQRRPQQGPTVRWASPPHRCRRTEEWGAAAGSWWAALVASHVPWVNSRSRISTPSTSIVSIAMPARRST